MKLHYLELIYFHFKQNCRNTKVIIAYINLYRINSTGKIRTFTVKLHQLMINQFYTNHNLIIVIITICENQKIILFTLGELSHLPGHISKSSLTLVYVAMSMGNP